MEKNRLKPGDIVEVRSQKEILQTLDLNGTTNNLPFMPEMIQYIGKKFNVTARIEKTCVECNDADKTKPCGKGEFINDDVVTLDNLRCNGKSHGDCQAGCLIFWKEAWLKKVDNGFNIKHADKEETWAKDERVINDVLKVADNDKYFCQSSQLSASTKYLSLKDSFVKLFRNTLTGDVQMSLALKSLIHAPVRKIRPASRIKGSLKKTPTEALHLKPGDMVEVKSYEDILKTLDEQGKNRGLTFYYEMKEHCGKRLRVKSRLDRMINEVSGEMTFLTNTVLLEDAICNYEDSFMGCPRQRFKIWREIWLKRVEV